MRDPYIVRRKRSSLETGYLKRIAELEEKNAVLEKNTHTSGLMYEKALTDLEKVSAELKATNGRCSELEAAKVTAKEIIAEWLRLYKTNTVKSLIEKSEDFIKD